ncbi:acetyltransferase [Vibrio splendidus]
MSDEVNLPIVMIGGGGHASVLADILLSQGREIVAYISPESALNSELFLGAKHLYDDYDILQFSQSKVLLVNGIGHMPKQALRKKLYQQYTSLGFKFSSVISENAIVSDYTKVADGVQILHGAIVQAGCKIGSNSIINTGVVVEHDCKVGGNVHIAPRATICGASEIGHNTFIGASAVIIQGLKIGDKCIIGAGVTVLKGIYNNTILTGK